MPRRSLAVAAVLVILTSCSSTPGGLDAALGDGAASDGAASDPSDGAAHDADPRDGASPHDSGPAPIDAGPRDGAGTTDAAGTPADATSPDTGASTPPDAGTSTTPRVDLDQDGLDDADEDRWARTYLPFLAVDPNDRCPRQAIVFRLRPHPARADRLLLVMVSLFETDCGAAGHVGDDEVFSLTIDPSLPAPGGILALRAIAHQSTACEEVSDCGTCPGLTACELHPRGGAPFPTVYFSTGKHGAYVSEAACDRSCFFTNFCTPPAVGVEPPMINAGEPGAPLVRDLTAAGLITAAGGWTAPEVMGFDPWGGLDFGGAGNVTDDLTDPAFVTPPCP